MTFEVWAELLDIKLRYKYGIDIDDVGGPDHFRDEFEIGISPESTVERLGEKYGLEDINETGW